MIRFIDLGKQIAVDETDQEYKREFAFYNTITDQFYHLNSSSTWNSWKDFEESFNLSFDMTHKDADILKLRMKSLCPSWVFE